MKLRIALALALSLLSAVALAQVNPGTSPLTGTKGGTNNAFMQFTGPAGSLKTFTLPNASDTIATLAAVRTWTGAQSFTDGTLILLGATSGSSTIKAPATGGGTATFFPGSDTIAGLAATQTLTNKTFNCANQTSCIVRIGTDVSGLGTGVATALGNTLNAAGGLVGFSGALGTPTSGTLTNATGLPANGGLTGQTPIANGGTGQTTAPAARASSGLNVDQFTGHGDSIYTILSTDRTVGTNAAFTASRTWTLPAANAVNAGQEIIVADFQGTVTATNTLVISRAGADTVNGGTTATITAANGAYLLKSDGVSKWTAQSMGAASGGGVTSVTCGTGLSGGTITTSGTCAVNLSTITNSLGADVLLNNTANYFDGPSVAQGTSGTWFASGTVTLNDTAGAAAIFCKLWDGTTVVSSAEQRTTVAGDPKSVSLSGFLAAPAANIRISCRDSSSTSGVIQFNATGNSKDSTISVFRIQ